MSELNVLNHGSWRSTVNPNNLLWDLAGTVSEIGLVINPHLWKHHPHSAQHMQDTGHQAYPNLLLDLLDAQTKWERATNPEEHYATLEVCITGTQPQSHCIQLTYVYMHQSKRMVQWLTLQWRVKVKPMSPL